MWSRFLNAIKGKYVSLWTKWRLWTSATHLKSVLFGKLQKWLSDLVDVRPRHTKDYYTLFGWLVSKKLAFAILIGLGILCTYYVFGMNAASLFRDSGDSVRTFSYDAVLLRFTQGKVRILGKSGYLAYEGEVKGGSAEGNGRLFYPDGTLAYQGELAANRYQGSGILYYPNGRMQYQGAFAENLYQGEGSLYRETGSLEYKGIFAQGLKEGAGVLYDAANNQVYQGNFSKDQLLYSELLNKSTQEVSKKYTGRRTIYTDEDYFAVCLHDIEAVYFGERSAELLDDSMMVTGIYVLQDYFCQNNKTLRNVAELMQELGAIGYEGNSAAIMPETVALRILAEENGSLHDAPKLQAEAVFDDVVEVLSYDMDYVLYLYSYEKEGLLYTFFCKDKLGEFDFYSIEKTAES